MTTDDDARRPRNDWPRIFCSSWPGLATLAGTFRNVMLPTRKVSSVMGATSMKPFAVLVSAE